MITAKQPFDILAENYDRDFSDTLIGRLQRDQVWQGLQNLLQSFHRPIHILEINCGTGVDAIKMAELGHHVVATDASPVMIEKAREKVAQHNIDQSRLIFEQCSFRELADYPFNKRFDLVFSDFGGLNCITKKELDALSQTLSGLLKEDGYLYFVIMGSFCAWETGYYLLRGKFNTAFRRQGRQADFEVNGKHMPVYYYAPRTVERLFRRFFRPVKNFAVGLFVPPSYLESFFAARKTWLDRLGKLDKKIGKYPLVSYFSDHYCMILKKDAAR